jgi:hypothetical protein
MVAYYSLWATRGGGKNSVSTGVDGEKGALPGPVDGGWRFQYDSECF